MKLKLSKVRKLEDSKFELIFRHDGQLKSVIITQNRHWIEDMQDYISVINSDDKDFYNLWGYADFRKEVSQKIKQLKEAEIHELQPA